MDTSRLSFALLLCSSCVGPWPNKSDSLLEEARVAFIYPGAIGDHGWSKAHNDGRLYLAEELDVETTYRELVAPPDLPSVIDELVEEDWNVLFTVSSDFISSTQQAASDHPSSYFFSCCGAVHSKNLTSYFGRMYQPLFLAGYTAGRMSCTKHLGVVAAKPFPEFVRHINAITLGARLADPSIVVDVRWLDSFFDPERETLLTEDLVASGADVILTQTDTTIPIETTAGQTVSCGEQTVPVYSVGYDNIDSCEHGLDHCLTSAYWSWGPLYAERVGTLLDGTWDPSDVAWRPMTNDSSSVVGLADLATFIPGEIRTDVGELRSELLAGSTQVPFVGPLVDNQDQERVIEGEEMDDAALDRMCWYVEGVVSSESGEIVPARVPTSCIGDT